MRKLSSEGIPFSFSFFTYDRDKKTGHGLRHIYRATLRATIAKDSMSIGDLLPTVIKTLGH